MQANVITGQAVIPNGYYNSVDHTAGTANILSALNSIIGSHTVLNYNSLESYYEQTDFYSDTVWDMYSTCRFTMAEANKPQDEVCDGWNKEHLVCQSWFSGGGPKSDLFNVYPTDARVNGMRSNYPYGEVNGAYGTGISKNNGHALGKVGSNTFSGYTGTVFEPHDDYKGDFARSFMYMAACYRTGSLNASYGSAMYTSSPTNFTAYAQNLLMKWHRDDPVSQKEIDRNQAVYGVQGNRNPFIDYPELAEYIWGARVGQTIDLASMIATCEGGTTGERVRYGIHYFVCGTSLRIDSVDQYDKPLIIDDVPVSCSEESNVFVGWTTAPIDGVTDIRPAILYRAGDKLAPVIDNIDLYAVFAHQQMDDSGAPAVYTYSYAERSEGWTNTAKDMNNSSYWLLVKGSAITSPVIDLMGLEKIVVRIRTYGGTQYDQLDIYEADGKLASITATAGKSLTDYTWTNNLYIAGLSALSFSSNYGEDKGIGISSITIHATGAGLVTDRYITDCEGAAGIENSQIAPKNEKILRDGRLLIKVGDQIYTVTGQKLQ